MFFEACLISYGLHVGSRLYRNIKDKFKNIPDPPKVQHDHAIQTVSSDPAEISDEEKMVNRNLSLSLITAGLASAGILFYPPLSILSAIGSLYISLPIFQKAKDAVFKEHRIRIELLDSLMAVLLLGNGYFFAWALNGFGYFGACKLRLKTEHKSKRALVNILGEQPHFVWVVKDGTEIQIPFESLQAGDIVVVSAGELIPADALITHGLSSTDQHMLTGEYQPTEKGIGDEVFAGTFVISGRLYIRVEKTGQETVAAKIGEILKNTSDFTALTESAGQEIADGSVLPRLALMILGYPFASSGGRVALCCTDFLSSMRISTPLSMLNFLQITSGEGILVKDGRSFQLLPQVDTVVFDKTGTLTLEQPHVRKIHTFSETEENTVLSCAGSAEYRQNHPIARAILEEARNRSLNIGEIDEANYKIGYGITVKADKQMIRVGSERFMKTEGICIPAAFYEIQKDSYEYGCSLVCVAADTRMIGAIELEPTVRPEAIQVIDRLKQYGMSLYIISGDHEKPTRAMARTLGIDHYFAEVLPKNKAELVGQLRKQGKKICFIGDGINDSIALKKADVSVSLLGASTAATDSAQVILMDQTLKRLPDLFDIAYDFQDNIRDTFFATSAPGLIGIGGVFFANFGVMGMVIAFGASLASGMAVSMLPALKIKGKHSSSDLKATYFGQRRLK